MQEMSTSEMAKELRDLMVYRCLSLRAAVDTKGWNYNAVYFRLRKDGWIVRSTLVKARKPVEAVR
jgi:hypothetical protein